MTNINPPEENRDLIAHIERQVEQYPERKEAKQPSTTTQGNPRPDADPSLASPSIKP